MSDINVVTEAAMAVDTKDLQCGICFDICYPVFETNCCGYLFCETHKEEMSKCPICRENSNNTRRAASNRPGFPHNSSKDYCHPAPTLNRLVGKLLSKCKFCEEQLMVSEMAAHQKNCPHRVHTCNMCKQQGSERLFKRQELLMHMTMEHSDEILKIHETYGDINSTTDHASNSSRSAHPTATMTFFDEIRARRVDPQQRQRANELRHHIGMANLPEPRNEASNPLGARQQGGHRWDSPHHEPVHDHGNLLLSDLQTRAVSRRDLDEMSNRNMQQQRYPRGTQRHPDNSHEPHRLFDIESDDRSVLDSDRRVRQRRAQGPMGLPEGVVEMFN